MKKKQLVKTITFTDIHFGRKNNSDQHNQDCTDFIDWLCTVIAKDPEIDSIAFLGDFFENRNAINVMTAGYAYGSMKKLSALGLPVFFVAGNHDCYHKHSRDVTSVRSFDSLPNITVIEQPLLVPHMGNGTLFSPYLFEHEYASVYEKYRKDARTWMGHFEFRGFLITGYNLVMPTGPNHLLFNDVTSILSGHFHKRQAKDNVLYTGNCFPMDFGDAGDTERGACVYDHRDNTVEFHTWEAQPRYTRVKMSTLLDDAADLSSLMHNKNRIKCIVDIPISHEESMEIKNHFLSSILKDYEIREFTIDESSSDLKSTLSSMSEIDSEEAENMGIDELIMRLLPTIESDSIDPQMLTDIFNSMRSDLQSN